VKVKTHEQGYRRGFPTRDPILSIRIIKIILTTALLVSILDRALYALQLNNRI
jgi:hypothetical protein